MDLHSLVAYCGSPISPLRPPRRPEKQVLRAVKLARRDSALARMLPVFLWRMRGRLDPPKLVAEARLAGEAAALGFFLEATARLGGSHVFDEALLRLSASGCPGEPSYFFHGTASRPFERIAADRATPAVARRWGLLMNMPWESFASYFAKASVL